MILIFLIGAYFLIRLLVEAIRDKIKTQKHLKKVQTVIDREKQYPDAYKEWFGAPYYINCLSDKELDKRLFRSEREWAEKQKEIEESRAREKALKLEQQQKMSRARSLSYRYPNAVNGIIESSSITNDTQVEKILSYTTAELKIIEDAIVEAQKRKKEEEEQKHNEIISNFPNGYELVKRLREESIDCEDLYLPDEYTRFQRGQKVATNKQKLVNIPLEVFDKYEDISVRYTYYCNWHKQQNEHSKKLRQLHDTTLENWGAYQYSIDIDGITQTGDNQTYDFSVWQFFSMSFCMSDEISYEHIEKYINNRKYLEGLEDGTVTFKTREYDSILQFITAMDEVPLVLIVNSELEDDWISINTTHFGYIYGKLEEHQIPYKPIELLTLDDIAYKTIVVLELITENSHLIDICQDLYSIIPGSKIVYITLFKEFSKEECLKVQKIKIAEVEEAARKTREEEARRRKEEAQRKEQEEKDRLYRLSHTFKTNSAEFKRHLTTNGVRYFYHFTDKRNLESIRKIGGLYSWQYCEDHNIEIARPGGDSTSRSLDRRHGLQDYVRVSFCTDHPMKWILEQQGYDMVLLKVKIDVACLEGTLFSDINATDNNHHHGGTLADLQRINIPATQQNFVSRESDIFKQHQAEVMVKTFIPLEYIEMPNITPIRKIYDDDLPF